MGRGGAAAQAGAETHACPHVATTVNLDELRARFRSPAFQKAVLAEAWTCSQCQEQSSVWLCLAERCDVVACGRATAGKHALAHYESGTNKQHMLCMNPRTRQIWCYACDEEVDNDPDLPADSFTNQLIDGLRALLVVEQSMQAGRFGGTVTSVAGARGLDNLGNTCFMNSALQAMSATAPLTQYLLRNAALLRELFPSAFVAAYIDLMEQLWGSQRAGSVTPRAFLGALYRANPMFRGFGQHDAQELLHTVWDKLHEGLKLPVAEPNDTWAHDVIDDAMTPEEQEEARRKAAEEASTKSAASKQQYESIVNDVLQGYLLSEVTCLVCHRVSKTVDPFYDLSVHIPSKKQRAKLEASMQSAAAAAAAAAAAQGGADDGTTPGGSGWLSGIGSWFGIGGKALTLHECLHSFVSTEELASDNMYRCERCKQRQPSQKKLTVVKLPEVLVVHLKRFKYETMWGSKVSTIVQYPLENLDMAPYCLPNFKEHTIGETRYDLCAVVNHRGALSGGHYIAFARNAVNSQWYEFDDSRVSPVSGEDVVRNEAFLMFYQRRAPDSFAASRARHEALIASHRIAPPTAAAMANGTTTTTGYVSLLWYEKWRTLPHPGPINNTDWICVHGNVALGVDLDQIANVAKAVPQQVFDEWMAEFGGGPVANSISECDVCAAEECAMTERRQRERRDVSTYDTTPVGDKHLWFLIDSAWLTRWRNFTRSGDLPGPISNNRLVGKDGVPRRRLECVSHYRGVNRNVWYYFQRAHGGGPVIARREINLYAAPVPAAEIEAELAMAARVVDHADSSDDHADEGDGNEEEEEEDEVQQQQHENNDNADDVQVEADVADLSEQTRSSDAAK